MGGEDNFLHPPSRPEMLNHLMQGGITFLQDYGWFVIIGVSTCYAIYQWWMDRQSRQGLQKTDMDRQRERERRLALQEKFDQTAEARHAARKKALRDERLAKGIEKYGPKRKVKMENVDFGDGELGRYKPDMEGRHRGRGGGGGGGG